jgi:hypothetical protein
MNNGQEEQSSAESSADWASGSFKLNEIILQQTARKKM